MRARGPGRGGRLADGRKQSRQPRQNQREMNLRASIIQREGETIVICRVGVGDRGAGRRGPGRAGSPDCA